MHKRSRHGSLEGGKILVREDLYVLKIHCIVGWREMVYLWV